MTTRVFLLGIGGLSLDVLDALIHNGWLPNLEFLLSRGAVGPLTSDIPPYAASEWATLLTGETPGTTGFLEGCRKGAGSYFPEVVSLAALARRSPRFLLARPSLETALVGVPIPAEPGPLPPRESVHLLEVKDGEISVRPLAPASDPVGTMEDDGDPALILEETIRHMVALSISISRTLKESRARLVAIHFGVLDRIFSRFNRDLESALLGRKERGLEELLRQFFRAFDDSLGGLQEISRGTETLIALVSPHGFVPAARVLNLNGFLLSRGDLSLRPSTGGDHLLRGMAAPLLRSMGIDRRHLKQILPRPALQEAVDRSGSLLSSEIGQFDWGRTRAFALSRTGITLNIRGVESQGRVNPGPQSRALGEEIREALLSLVDPATGRSPVGEVRWREDLYEGPGLPELPHLVVRGWDPGYLFDDWRHATSDCPVFSDPRGRTGAPREGGFYCLFGAGSFFEKALKRRLHLPRTRSLAEMTALVGHALDGEQTADPESLFTPR